VAAFGRDLFPDPRGVVLPERLVLPVQAYLLMRDGQPPVLIDTGSGAAEGGVAVALQALGVDRGDIGTVIFTHLHGDHRGGYLAGGYERAMVVLSRGEADYWGGQDHPARQVLELAGKKLVLVEDCEEPMPGLRVWSLPGHTPGHAGLVIDGRIAMVGDILHRADLQLADPELSTRFDVDPALARVTRKAALARIAAEDMVVCGCHMRLPGQEEAPMGAGFLRLAAKGDGWTARVG
jgi:glyoxylase-like metal-dependent hydrolase (beta-lactamase superfamily II)